ncbi:MAG TPA: hypothetical protein VFZ70_08420 [Euzebyales bacterium]
MAGHQLIEEHLAQLAGRLPGGAVDELADGLTETWHHHLATGLPPTSAAHAATAEFGTPDQIIDAFVTHAPARRMALRLLASGPVVGACWAAGLIAGRGWTWPLPHPLRIVFGVLLCGVIVALLAATTSRHSYRRTRLGAAGGVVLVTLDAAMLATVSVITPPLAWPLLAAILASLTRIAWTARSLPAALGPRHAASAGAGGTRTGG